MPSERYDYYLDQCKQHHVISKTFSGNGCLKHARTLIEFSHQIEARSGIDYGCGKGNQYAKVIQPYGESGGPLLTLEQHLGYLVTKYDPAVKGFHKPPEGPADLVWCTDVLEHIPEEDIPWVIDELLRLSRLGLFVTVGTYPAKKTLPNGENAHVTVKDGDWWRAQFEPAYQLVASSAAPFRFMLLVE